MGNPEQKILAEHLRALPKVELHLHLEGSLSPTLLLKLADRNRLRLPFKHKEDFESIYRYKSFKDFSNLLLLGVACLRKPEDFSDAVRDLGHALIEENVKYAEVTWTPQFYLNRGFPLQNILEAMNGARNDLERLYGLKLRWIPDIVRSRPQYANRIATWASSRAGREAGIVALGLGGPEVSNSSAIFIKPFSIARNAGLPANPHAGESEGADSVWDTIRYLKPSRIGHGVRSIDDINLLEYLKRQKIPLEVCITSNIRLGIFSDYETHPVKDLIRAGCIVILNTDDPVLFNTTLSQEYILAITRCGLSMNDIENSILAGIKSSYLNEYEKSLLSSKFCDEFTRLQLKSYEDNLNLQKL